MEIPKTPTTESSLEQREKDQLPILFIYRDNDLFREYMPGIINNLQAWGRKVETQIFPQGTDEEKIDEWFDSKILETKTKARRLDRKYIYTVHPDLMGKEIMTDWTASRSMSSRTKRRGFDIENKIEETGTKFMGHREKIDKIFDDVVESVILGDMSIHGLSRRTELGDKTLEEMMQRYGHVIAEIVKLILEKEPAPNKVYILTDSLYDHVPFGAIRAEKAKEKGIDEDEYKVGEEECRYAVELITEWLVKGGIQKDSIFSMNNIISSSIPEKNEKGESTWFIFDRHNFEPKWNLPKSKECRLLSLPAGNFYSDARDQHLFNLDTPEFKKKLNEAFKKLFVDKAEEK